MAKVKKTESKLKEFAKQYRMIECDGYRFVECPAPNISFLEQAAYCPVSENTVKVRELIEKNGRWIGYYSHFYSKRLMCWFVIDHLWLAMLPAWGNDEMQVYMRKVFAQMISKAWSIQEEEKPKTRMQELFEDTNGTQEKVIVPEKKSPILKKIEEEVISDEIFDTYGVSREVLHHIMSDGYDDLVSEMCGPVNADTLRKSLTHCHILTLSKVVFSKYKLSMKDLYVALKDAGIITQSDDRSIGKYHIYASSKAIENGWAADKHDPEKNTDYPMFTPKGILNISLILKEKNIIPNHLLFIKTY